MESTIKDIWELEKRVYDRDKPFFQVFGDELVKHKEMITKILSKMKEEHSLE